MICRWTISFLYFFGLLCCTTARAEILPLVERAARPEVMFGAPAAFDSLLRRISAGGAGSASELLELADTPWAWRFEVVRQGLERIGEPARMAVLHRLDEKGRTESETARLLVLFEKLGQVGDESCLAAYLRGESRAVTVPALRCLAAFGEPEKSLELVQPLLGDEDPHVRLAAVWTVGELIRRQPPAGKKAERLIESVRPLLDDPVLQIRLTAAGCLQVHGSTPAPSLLRRQ
ncbi:MAG: HEAT repeat domain-containing protein [Candidatus Glassbacteria bacterium]|nr:HEAT repeat domain-containing protein [Candidatus Glassbacteria bacterium]